ncbi:MAG: hypothetical protein NW215_12340 [Hyphomicrobiales bacterium]|nr:hypothetical protein [Hyphomicrobiales bacterium]
MDDFEDITLRDFLLSILEQNGGDREGLMAAMEERIGQKVLDSRIDSVEKNLTFIMSEFMNLANSMNVYIEHLFEEPKDDDPEMQSRWEKLLYSVWRLLEQYGSIGCGEEDLFFIVEDFYNVEEVLVEMLSQHVDLNEIRERTQILVNGGKGCVRFRLLDQGAEILVSPDANGPACLN